MSRVAEHEPAPVPNNRSGAHDLVIADILASGWMATTGAAVILDLEERREMGLKKYGTLLQASNGRDAVMDAYQESLDLVAYLRQALEEGRPVISLYRASLSFVLELRRALNRAVVT